MRINSYRFTFFNKYACSLIYDFLTQKIDIIKIDILINHAAAMVYIVSELQNTFTNKGALNQ
jgi:hypothetical protein